MMRLFLLVITALSLAACARPFGTGNDFELKKPVPNPSAVVAAEIALHQSIARDGLTKALRDTASDDARIFAPDLVNAQDAIKSGRTGNAQSGADVYTVYMSCDGKLAAATGAFRLADGSTGAFTNIWRREYDTRGGSADWKWVLRYEGVKQTGLAKPEYIQTRIAPCNGNVPFAVPASRDRQRSLVTAAAMSPDRTLRVDAASDGTMHMLTVNIWDGEKYYAVVDSEAKAARQ